MARIEIRTFDELYQPRWNQASSARIEGVIPYPDLSVITDLNLSSASSKYDPTGLDNYTEISPRELEEQLDWLEYLDDLEDLKMLEDMRKRPLKFRKFEDFMKEHGLSV